MMILITVGMSNHIYMFCTSIMTNMTPSIGLIRMADELTGYLSHRTPRALYFT